MQMISCKDYAKIRKDELKKEISKMRPKYGKPYLVVFQVDKDFGSNKYISYKKKDSEYVGIELDHIEIDSSKTSQEEFEYIVKEMANAKYTDGIIIQLPIPDKYDLNKLIDLIPKEKDVDGFKKDSRFKACTPKGIKDWIDYNNYDLKGKNVVVLGRSLTVGKPMVDIAIDAGATVSCCNSNTDFRTRLELLRRANVIISAVGKQNFLSCGQCCNYERVVFENDLDLIIDVGINEDENGKLCGDVNHDEFYNELPETYITPVPGGVGLLTRLALIENVFEAYIYNNEEMKND